MRKIIIVLLSNIIAITMLLPSITAISDNSIDFYSTYPDSKTIQMFRSENDPVINIISKNDLASTCINEPENDMGYNVDVSDRIQGSAPIYVGEPVDNAPGRTRTGSLDPDAGDDQDWYRFYVCEGQSIQTSIETSEDFGVYLMDSTGNNLGTSYDVDITAIYFVCVFSNDGANSGNYYLDVSLINQNDAGSGGDAGNTVNSALRINPGTYVGYMDFNDVEDWYSFAVNQGDSITFNVVPLEKSDYDIHLYNPNGIKVHSATYYGEDTLEYPIDQSGTWTIQLDMFPGWDASKWPDNYFLYGSGPYELTFEVGGSYNLPVPPKTQPDIKPIANTFIINDNPSSNTDEYSYIATIPAANYISNGNRYVSPIIYNGVNTMTNWFGTVDDTTQYLLDDWDIYLQRHGITANEYIVDANPIKAAAEIATRYWESSTKAVLVCDGSSFVDEVESIIDGDFSMSSTPVTKRYYPGDFLEFDGSFAIPMFIGKQWGAIHMIALGDNFNGNTGLLTPRYEEVHFDDWPSPYDENGPDYDTWYPITIPGIWVPELTSETNLEELQIIKYPGDRYSIPIDTSDCSIEVNLQTQEPSELLAYLVDPDGNIRRPIIPSWNGGEINPIHQWNGGHWQDNSDEYRYWIVEPHEEFSFDLHYPMTGKWTIIIVPYFEHPSLSGGYIGDYHLTVNIRNHNSDRTDAAISAANGAVLSSLNHAPLLYVTKNAVPSETANALSTLGVNEVLFINLNDISSASPSGSVTEYTSMKQIIDAIKSSPFSENYITITSLGSGNGYFAPAAMIAAYHTSPVLSIQEAAKGYDLLDKLVRWEEYCGDYYHGCRTMGHLPAMQEPTDLNNPPSYLDLIIYYLTHNKTLPPRGLDLKLQWYSQIYDSIHTMIDSYGLDNDGQEAYMFVSSRDTDLPSHISRAMMGNESFAGQIPFDTPAMDTALICRDILYPALIYSNPGRDVTSTCLMNHWENFQWKTNNGQQWTNEFTRKVKEYFSSNNRIYIGHTLWTNLLEQYNNGASVIYHSSHGTGGSGICCMYENVAQQFPLAHLTHENLHDFTWWDGWRAYYYDDTLTKSPRENGRVWFNSEEPNLYDIVHFKWCDQLFTNLHSQMTLWQSCTTAHNFGPEIYLEHGAALFYGNSNTGRSPQTDMQDSWWFEDFMVRGLSIGEAHSKLLWLFDRDYTTCDPTSLYGFSSIDEADQLGDGLGQVNTWLIFGDPTLQVYNPLWTEPIPEDI